MGGSSGSRLGPSGFHFPLCYLEAKHTYVKKIKRDSKLILDEKIEKKSTVSTSRSVVEKKEKRHLVFKDIGCMEN